MPTGYRIAVGGKGGVGKTTVCSVWAQLLARSGYDVLAIDADPDTNLALALGVAKDQVPVPLIKMKELIGERTGTGREAVGAYFKMNPDVSDLPEKYWHQVNGLKLLVLGGITQAGTGCACSEGTFLRALLSHTILQRQELVIVDLDAGVECMGRSSISGIDALVVVVEPGSRSIETAVNIANMARDLNIGHVTAVANKVTSPDQIEMISEKLGNVPLLTSIEYTPAIQQADMAKANVYGASQSVVDQLEKAKDTLMGIIDSGQKK